MVSLPSIKASWDCQQAKASLYYVRATSLIIDTLCQNTIILISSLSIKAMWDCQQAKASLYYVRATFNCGFFVSKHNRFLCELDFPNHNTNQVWTPTNFLVSILFRYCFGAISLLVRSYFASLNNTSSTLFRYSKNSVLFRYCFDLIAGTRIRELVSILAPEPPKLINHFKLPKLIHGAKNYRNYSRFPKSQLLAA